MLVQLDRAQLVTPLVADDGLVAIDEIGAGSYDLVAVFWGSLQR